MSDRIGENFMHWIYSRFTLGLAGYGIQFGVSALSGSIYINVFVIGLIGSPIQIILIPLQNRLSVFISDLEI